MLVLLTARTGKKDYLFICLSTVHAQTTYSLRLLNQDVYCSPHRFKQVINVT